MLGVGLVFLVLLLFIFLGFPIFMSVVITAVVFIVAMGIPFSLVIIKMFGSVNSFALMAIPFFIVAGNIMMQSRITDKLVNFADALVGSFRGGLGHVNILASMLFGGIQGSGAADAAAIGGMLIPAMEKQGYDKDYAVAVTAGSAMLSPIIPPSIAMILYSYYTGAPVGLLFLGGILPGILIGAGQMAANFFMYKHRKYDIPLTPFTCSGLVRAFYHSFWALIMPFIILCGIVFGFVTPTESGVLAIVYGLFYGFFISGRLRMAQLPGILLDSAITTSVVMMTISAAGVLSNVLVRMRFQNEVLALAMEVIQGPIAATLFIMAVLLVLGCFLDPTVLIAMFGPTIFALGNALGFDPIHYGVLMVVVMQVGAITPPVGTFLFIACGVAGLPLEKSVKPLMPFLLVIIAVILLAIFVPEIITLIPGWFSA
ncbi:MAG: TRAP transporter large permease [Planctomycetota bacterium]|jgi:C4-dicarboxylate transporter DctM subunit|nr:TRAP transporter large permease [Planctomycetota bacterium]